MTLRSIENSVIRLLTYKHFNLILRASATGRIHGNYVSMRKSEAMRITHSCEKLSTDYTLGSVSESFWSNLKFLRMMHLTAWLWGWNLRVNGMRSVFSFYYVCRADYRWIYWTPYLFQYKYIFTALQIFGETSIRVCCTRKIYMQSRTCIEISSQTETRWNAIRGTM